MSRRRGLAAVAAVLASLVVAVGVVFLAGDRDGGGASAGDPIVYVAVGASDSVGVGTDDPATQAWPKLFVDAALPAGSQYTNVAVSGSTTSRALTEQVPRAVAASPDLVTVWLNVNDIRAFVSPETYGTQLRQLVEALRRGGETTVLVANTPELDQLPAAQSLRLPGALVEARVDEYNAVIEDVVDDTGAVLVDLNAQSERFESEGRILDLTAADGFHPNPAGHREVARVFQDAYVRVADSI